MISQRKDNDYAIIFSKSNSLIFIIGSLLNFIAYESFTPTLVFAFFFCSIIFFLAIVISNSKLFFVAAFIKLAIIYWLMSGIAAVFLLYGDDPSQMYGDADGFFKIAIGSANDLDIEEIKLYHEGSLAILIWKYFYNTLFSIGISKEKYIGIIVNIINVSLAGIIIIKSVSVIYPNNIEKTSRCLKYISFCGVMWLYASIHLRDSFLLLVLSYFYYVWVVFIKSKEKIVINFLKGLVITFVSTVAVYFLRGSIVFIPCSIALIAIFTYLFSQRKISILLLGFVMLFFLLSVVLVKYRDDLNSIIEGIKLLNTEYASLSVDQHISTTSLGVSLIISQPLFIRIPLGLAYLFLFPIPIWNSITQGAYWLFTSSNTILLYFLIPNFFFTTISIYKKNESKNVAVLFSFICFIFLSIGISSTSLESRHLGTLLPFFFILVVYPNYEDSNVKLKIVNFRIVYLSAVVLIHFLWFIFKFIS